MNMARVVFLGFSLGVEMAGSEFGRELYGKFLWHVGGRQTLHYVAERVAISNPGSALLLL